VYVFHARDGSGRGEVFTLSVRNMVVSKAHSIALPAFTNRILALWRLTTSFVSGTIMFGEILYDRRHLADTNYAIIDVAQTGDTVLVYDGIYTGDGNKNLDFKGKKIIVTSLNGQASTIIDCEGSGRAFYFHSGETPDSVLSGFTIGNGEPDVSPPPPNLIQIDHIRQENYA
jgi:hypothetical protein